MAQRVIMVGFDGFEPSIADRMMAEGRLPALAALRAEGALIPLDHGAAKRTGLAWEHVATGQSPDRAGRWAAVDFDPRTYAVEQAKTVRAPFTANRPFRTALFDAPYFNIYEDENAVGAVNWGAHDPGVSRGSRPDGLLQEIEAKFGAYPAKEWIYGFVWQDADAARKMAAELVEAADVRTRITEWLLAERLPDWDLGITVYSEFHSAVEALWHGVDPQHPLHGLPSTDAAREGLEGVYIAADRGFARLRETFPDARVVVFNLHGMGRNDSDPASMLLLPELMYRRNFRSPLLAERDWPKTEGGYPLLREDEEWHGEVLALLEHPVGPLQRAERAVRRLIGRDWTVADPDIGSLGWMPAAHYRRYWPRMDAFALPSFYDGRVRVNLQGREARGRVALADYDAVLADIERALADCRNPITGEAAILATERNPHNPMTLTASEADLIVTWNGGPLGLDHPRLGRMGPVPFRRSGGHSGGLGVAYVGGPGVAGGTYETRSAFDVVPTVLDMLDAGGRNDLSGSSFWAEIQSERVEA